MKNLLFENSEVITLPTFLSSFKQFQTRKKTSQHFSNCFSNSNCINNANWMRDALKKINDNIFFNKWFLKGGVGGWGSAIWEKFPNNPVNFFRVRPLLHSFHNVCTFWQIIRKHMPERPAVPSLLWCFRNKLLKMCKMGKLQKIHFQNF